MGDKLSFESIAFEGTQDGQLAASIAMDFCWLAKARGLHSHVRINHLTHLGQICQRELNYFYKG